MQEREAKTNEQVANFLKEQTKLEKELSEFETLRKENIFKIESEQVSASNFYKFTCIGFLFWSIVPILLRMYYKRNTLSSITKIKKK